MKITRKEFLNVAAGAAALATIPSFGTLAAACAQPALTGKPKRGISVYSFAEPLNVTMTLEDCFSEIKDTGAHGLEILASMVKNYPNPSDEWIEWYWAMMKKYDLTPVEYGHWVDANMIPGRLLTTKESYDMLVRDLRLANKLGYTRTRTYLGVIDQERRPVQNWKEFIEMALPVAEELNIKMCVEIHPPARLDMQYMQDEYINFIEKTGTKWFGFNMDFGIFQNKLLPGDEGPLRKSSKPEEIIPYLPYTYCCHAKFHNISDEMEDTTIPYRELIDIMIKHKWDGYLLSEYEGPNPNVREVISGQIRRQHIMLKKLLGA
jgi:hypothetical protein